MACMFIQNSGLVRKNRASRKAVSAVTARSLFDHCPHADGRHAKGHRKRVHRKPERLQKLYGNHLPRMGGDPIGGGVCLFLLGSLYGPGKARTDHHEAQTGLILKPRT
jgi:hypothetical protein